MRKRKFLSLLLSVTLLIVLAACNGGSSHGDNDDTLIVMLDSEPAENDPTIAALDKWSEESGNNYEILIVGYDDQLTKFPLMIRNDDLPDLLITTRLHKDYPEEFVDLGAKIGTEQFDPNVLKVGLGNYSDSIYVLPTQVTITNYFYNKEAFEAAGIEVPDVNAPWTLDELYANAEKLVDSGAVKFGFAVDYSRARYDNLMYSNGGSITEMEGDNVLVSLNSQENINTLQRFIDLNQSDVIPRNIWSGGSSDNPLNYFQNGDVGIYLSGSFNYAEIARDSSIEFGVMPSPVGSEQQSSLLGGRGWAVPKNSKNADLAVEFVEWFYHDVENYQNYLDLDYGLPFMTAYDYVPEFTFAPADYEVYLTELEKVPSQFLIDESNQWGLYLDDEYRQALSQAVAGEISAEEALTKVAQNIANNADWGMKFQ